MVATRRPVRAAAIHRGGSSTPVAGAGRRGMRASGPAKEEQWKD